MNPTGDGLSDAAKRLFTFESDVNGNEISGPGYVVRGKTLTAVSVSQAVQVVTFTSGNPTWTASTFSANGVWLIKHLGTAAASPLFAYFTFGGAVSASGGTILLQVNAAGWLTQAGG